MSAGYLLAGQQGEFARLRLQSQVWEPSGRGLLADLTAPQRARAVDIGCGAMGWLRLLGEWVGPEGSVVGTDIDDRMIDAARAFLTEERIGNVELVKDDLFASQLPAGGFDLVHARFLIAPLGRADEQITAYRRLVRPGGWIVLEDPDTGSWWFEPEAPACRRLIDLILRGFAAAGGDPDAGRRHFALLRGLGLAPWLRAAVVALPPGHPYLRHPLQFARSLRSQALVPEAELDALVGEAERELAAPDRWGMTFTLIQAWARLDR